MPYPKSFKAHSLNLNIRWREACLYITGEEVAGIASEIFTWIIEIINPQAQEAEGYHIENLSKENEIETLASL